MKSIPLPFVPLGLAALMAPSLLAAAQIRSLSLYEMVDLSDRSVQGEIVASSVQRVQGGPEDEFLYYTRLTVQGTTLGDGNPISVDVCFPGGFVNEEEGVWNSESPAAEEVAVGNTIVAFYTFGSSLDGHVDANWLTANHGGVYQSVTGPKGQVVLGRGTGYAVDKNISLANLDTAVGRIQEELQREREGR